MASFVEKTIRVTVQLAEGVFAGGGNTKVMEGLTMAAVINKPGLPEKSKAEVAVAGLNYNDMTQLTTLGFAPLKRNKNVITIQAGERGASSLPVIFYGEITSAFADFNTSPEVTFKLEAQAGAYPVLIASAQQSVSGSATAAQLIEKFAGEAGYDFVNHGVTASVRNAVFNGSPVEKARAVAEQVRCELIIDDGVFRILPAGGVVSGNTIVLSKESGLIGYPSFDSDGIVLKALFNLDFKLGGRIQVDSIVPRASGLWKISSLSHSLSINSSGGTPWTTEIKGVYIS